MAHAGLVCFRCARRPGNGLPHLQHAGGQGVRPDLRLPHHLQGGVRGRRARHEGGARVRGELMRCDGGGGGGGGELSLFFFVFP